MRFVKKIVRVFTFILMVGSIAFYGSQQAVLEETSLDSRFEVLTKYSHPQQGGIWDVDFETVGQADLKIIPDNQATIDDMDFVSLSCGGQEKEAQILENDVIYYPNWSCDGVGEVEHLISEAGSHTLKFVFDSAVAYSYNSAGVSKIDEHLAYSGDRLGTQNFDVVSGTDKLMVLFAGGQMSGEPAFSSSPTWSGDSLTTIYNTSGTYMGYLLNPESGTHDLTLPWYYSDSFRDTSIAVYVFENVDSYRSGSSQSRAIGRGGDADFALGNTDDLLVYKAGRGKGGDYTNCDMDDPHFATYDLDCGGLYYLRTMWGVAQNDSDEIGWNGFVAGDNWYVGAAAFVPYVNTAPSAPTSLLAEGQTNPTGVTDTTPEFSAIYDDVETDDVATHAEVEVGTSAGANNMWDSGSINIADVNEGSRSSNISYAGSSLSWGTQYYWRIRFYDGDAWGSWSSNANFTMQSVPSAPSGTTAHYSVTNNSYATWTDNSSNEDRFRVEYSINDGSWTFFENASANATQSSTKSVGADNKIEWRVRSENTAGSSSYSYSGSAYMIPSNPGTPSLSWSSQDETVSVAWVDNSSYESDFEIQRSTDDGAWSSNIATPTSSSYDDTGPTGVDKKYEYRIRARTPSGDASIKYSSWVYSSGGIYSTPNAPTGITAHYSATDSSYATWTDTSSYEDQFRVEYSINDGSWTFFENASANSTQSSIKSVGSDNKIEWRVRAGNPDADSSYASSGTAYMVPANPGTPSLSWSSQDETVSVAWVDNSSYESDFEIQRSTDDGAWSSNIATPTSSSYDDTGPTGVDKKYEYRIRARTPAGDASIQYSSWVASSGAMYSTPSDPTGASASWGTQDEAADITWTSNSAYGDFDVQRSTDGLDYSNITYDSASPYSDSDPSGSDSKYQWRVRARTPSSDDGIREYSGFSVTSELFATPAVPTGASGSVQNGNETKVTWADNATYEDGYYVERSTDGGSWELYKDLGANVTDSGWEEVGFDKKIEYRVSSYIGSTFSSTNTASAVYTNKTPDAPSSLGPTSFVDGSYTNDAAPTLNFTLSDPDTSDLVKYRIQIDDTDNSFNSLVVDYESGLDSDGSKSFTVGQSGGSYTVGSAEQTLSEGSYYWRVRVEDDDGAVSSYSTANSGSVAFTIDTTAPSVPASVSADSTPTTDTTPSWSWSASTDNSSSVDSYSVKWCDNSSYTGCDSNTDSTATNSYTHSTSLADGDWYFKVKAIDGAGNESIYSDSTVEVDTGDPSISSLTQYQSDGSTVITTGGEADGTTVVLEVEMTDDDSDTLTPEVEVKEVGTAFDGTNTVSGSGKSYSGSAVSEQINVSGLSDLTSYHWRARVCDGLNNCSSWSSYGGNGEDVKDFEVILNTAPDVPSSLGPSGLIDGSYTGDNTPTLNFTLDDPDDSEQVKYQIQIDDSSDFLSLAVDYISDFAAEGSRSFTVGQALNGGSYAEGSEGQTFSDASYYWKVKAIDDDSESSTFVTANSGNTAFIVDATAPTVPSSVSPDTTPTANNIPTWGWTASTDLGSGLASTPYTVQWCDNNGFTGCSLNTSTTSTASFTHSTALSDGTWYLRVKAQDDIGNESSYSSASSVVVDTASPSNFELEEPDSKAYISEERPEFGWAKDGTALTYKIEVENGEDDFEVSGISASGSGIVENDKYEVKYEDDKIFFQTKSSDSWGDSDNNGKLNGGEREFTVTATDSSSNTATKSQKFFVDRSEPVIQIEEMGEEGFENNETFTRSISKIKVKVIDELNGEGDKAASGPEKGEITIKRKGLLGIYTKVTSEEFDFDKIKWEDTGQEADDDKNDDNKYGTYTLSLDEELDSDDYKIIVSAEDKVGNESEEEFDFTVALPVEIFVTQTPTPQQLTQPTPSEEETQPEPPTEEEQKEEKRTYQVSVRLRDLVGKPVPNATINLGNSKFETNRQGKVSISEVKEGQHSVKVSYKDYVGQKDIVLGGDSEHQSIEIQMQVEAGPRNPVVKTLSNIWNFVSNTIFGWIPSVFGTFSSR